MMEEVELERYRLEGTYVRVIRDMLEMNDVKGIVVAWDDESVLIRKRNRRVVKLSRTYVIQVADKPRVVLEHGHEDKK